MVKRLPEGVTQLLEKWSQGDEEALNQLLPLVYDELHRLAGAYLRRERHEHTLQPTALVNEAFLKLIDQHSIRWQNRSQFYGVAALLDAGLRFMPLLCNLFPHGSAYATTPHAEPETAIIRTSLCSYEIAGLA